MHQPNEIGIKLWRTGKHCIRDEDAKFDKELNIKAEDIEPMITYGTNPGMGIGVSGHVPELNEVAKENFL